jgi:Glycosyltransferase 61
MRHALLLFALASSSAQASCTGEHRPGALAELRASLKPACAGSDSNVRCAFRRVDQFPESFCEASNVYVDGTLFREWLAHTTADLDGDEVHLLDGANYYLNSIPRGVFRSACQPTWQDADFGKGGGRALFDGHVSDASAASQSGCKRVRGDVLVMARVYGMGNPWHAFEDWLHIYESIHTHSLRRTLRIVVLDAPTKLYVKDLMDVYGPVIERAHTPLHSIVTMHELMGNSTCLLLRRSAWSVHGGISAFQRSVGDVTQCSPSPLMQGFRESVFTGLPELRVVAMVPNRTVVIVRGASTKRKVENPFWTSFSERARSDPRFLLVDFAEYSVFEQLKIARSASHLIGLHGAALSHAFWMHPEATVTEVDTGFRCHCYANIARWLGVGYTKIDPSALQSM